MFDDGLEEQEVVLCCDNKLMQNVIDRFGEEIETTRIDESSFRAKIKVRPSRTFFSWVFGFCGEIRITEPEGVRGDYEKLLLNVIQRQCMREAEPTI